VPLNWNFPAKIGPKTRSQVSDSIKAHIINPQVHRFTTAQTVPVHHQEEQMISCALPATLSSLKERLDLSWIKEVLPSMWISDRTLHIIRDGKVAH
jgi:hypothetical protein